MTDQITRRALLGKLAIGMVAAAGVAAVKELSAAPRALLTDNLDPYTVATGPEGTCHQNHALVQYYLRAVRNSDGVTLATVHYGWTGVTHNGNGTCTATLADLKALLGSGYGDVTVKWQVVDNCGPHESTVAILD